MNWQYIAGFFDGEGSIILKNGRSRIAIVQTNKPVLESIKKFTKCGNIFEVTKRKPHWKDCWVYSISCKKDIYNFLRKITPYLFVKKELAEKGILQLKKELIKMEERKKKYIYRKHMAKLLRKKGLSYRAIGKELSMDWGHARRMILNIK